MMMPERMMMIGKNLLLAALMIFPLQVPGSNPPTFWSWAERPVMGWNSWDFYGTTLTEAQAKAQADYMASNLVAHGWNVLTVDIQWYAPNPAADGNYFNYETPNDQLVMDAYGRLQPATTRFPSATNNTGLTSLAEYVHSKGLQFGIHMMRGIPRQAVVDDLPVYGTTNTASHIADTSSTCPWNPDMYGVDLSKPGAQEYYDGLYQMVADWGVDFVKIDDISRPYGPVQQAEIEAIREAIDKTGRAIILSLSPGETPLNKGEHVRFHANQWRISDDFWDNWGALYAQFQRLHEWTPYRGSGYFPDADMLPLGKVGAGGADPDGRTSNFTQDEQYTLMTLWSIARSPLIHGGDMTQMDGFTLSLLTNDEVIAVNQLSTHNRQLFRDNDRIAWVADAVGSSNKYLALFNTSGSAASVPVDLTDLGYHGTCTIRRLWDQTDLGTNSGIFSPGIQSHGAGLYRLSGEVVPTPWISDISAGSDNLTVVWEEIASASSYTVKRALSETGTFVTLAGGVTNVSFTDAAVTNGVVYYYAISAVVGGQESPDSNVRSAYLVSESPGIVSWNYDRFGTIESRGIAGVEPAINWNNSWPDNPVVDLRDNTGLPTSLDITYSSHNTWSIQGSHPGLDSDGTSNKELLNGYLNAGPATWNPPVTASSVTFSEVPGSYYDLIVYFSSDVAGREGYVTHNGITHYFSTLGPPSISGANAVFARTTQTTNSFYPPANYAVFGGLTADSGTVRVQMRDNDEWAGIAGIQIVPRSDPLAAASLAIQPGGSGTDVILSWSAGLGEVVLEESVGLQGWMPSSSQPVTNAVVVPVQSGARFFRLARP